MDYLAASGQAIAHSRVLAPLQGHDCCSNKGSDAAQMLGSPDKANANKLALIPESVEPAQDVVDVAPMAETMADLQAIMERLKQTATGEGAREVLTDLKNFVNDNTNAQFAGGVLSEVGELAGEVLQALEEDPNAFGNFVSFDFNFQFSQKSLQSASSSLEATSFSFDFSFVSENTSFRASLDFSEKTLESMGSYQHRTSESVKVDIVTSNLDIDSNPALEGFIDITNRLLGPASPFGGIAASTQGRDAPASSPTEEGAGNVPEAVQPSMLRNKLFQLDQSTDVRKRTMELLESLFARIGERRQEGLAGAEPLAETA